MGRLELDLGGIDCDFMGRLELDLGGIDCKFGGLSPLASTSVEKCHNFFNNLV